MSLGKSDWIWLNGQFVPWDEAKTHVLDHGIHYGTGIFEGIRTYKTQDGNSAIFRLEGHVERMFKSAEIIQMKIPYEQKKIEEVIVEAVRKNKLTECYIRPLVWFGYGEIGVYVRNPPVNVMVAAWEWGKYLGKEALEEGIRTKISTWIRNNPNAFPSQIKNTGSYLNAVLAAREVRAMGYNEAIMLDHRGFISEGPGENIFIVENEVLLTPPLHASILPGITRDTVITLAQDLDYEVKETDITRSRLYNADEAFFTGTAAEVTPIREVDDRRIGSGKRGPVTERIQEEYLATVRGERQQYKCWLTYVYE